MNKIRKRTPNKWFYFQSEEAENFCTSIFKHAKIGSEDQDEFTIIRENSILEGEENALASWRLKDQFDVSRREYLTGLSISTLIRGWRRST